MLKILLVDDEREEREGIAFLIRKYGYPLTVAQAPNGKKALEYLEREPADILFTDVKMPLMNGLELAKEVCGRWPQIRIIIFSAYGEFDYAKQALEANAVNYLLKPIEIEEFRRVMEELLETITKERQKEEERRQEDWQNRQNVIFKFLTGAPLQPGEWERLERELFSAGSRCRLVQVEFPESFFDRQEDLFLKLVTMYLGQETEYVNLFANEACLLVREENYLDRGVLEGQLLKLSRDAVSFGGAAPLFIVGRKTDSLLKMQQEASCIQQMQQEFIAGGTAILWTERESGPEGVSREIEEAYCRLKGAAESRSAVLLEQSGEKLAQAVKTRGQVSRLYVQNLLFSALRDVYEHFPGAGQEYILNASESLFYAKNLSELADRFLELLHKMLSARPAGEEESPAVIQRIRSLVERDCGRDLSLDYVASRVNLAPAYVSYIFKKETGKSLIKYITDVRMEKAGELLKEGRLKIAQVAKACGYENPSYFNRTFKNYYGVTPRQFKEGKSE